MHAFLIKRNKIFSVIKLLCEVQMVISSQTCFTGLLNKAAMKIYSFPI